MSVDATKWAWSLSMPATRKIVLLSMADRAGETHACWPSIARLEADTCLDRKTILAAIADLESMGLITVSRSLGQGNCYQLVGVNSRETSPNNGTASSKKPVPKTGHPPVPKTGPVPISGPVPKTEPHPYQKRDTHQYQKRDTESINEPKKNLSDDFERDFEPPKNPSLATAVCVAMRSTGMQACNAGHPELLALIESGAGVDAFTGAAKDAMARGKGFSYALKIVASQMASAGNIAKSAIEKQTMASAFAGGI